MRLDNSRESSKIEDRRGRRMRMGGRGKIGLGTIVLALVAMYFGIDPGIVLQNATAPVDEASYDNGPASRSEEHTSELQSLMRISYAVFCLKKKKIKRSNQKSLFTRTRVLTT